MLKLNSSESCQSLTNSNSKPHLSKKKILEKIEKPKSEVEFPLSMHVSSNSVSSHPQNEISPHISNEEVSIKNDIKKNEEAEMNSPFDLDKNTRRMKIINDFQANRLSRKSLAHLNEIHHPDEGFLFLIVDKKCSLDYNPLHIPPNWSISKNHGHARSIGIPLKTEDISICVCCGYEINRKPLAFCDSPHHLKYLGSGYPLLFNFYKFCIYLLVLWLLLGGIYSINLNRQGSFCSSDLLDGSHQTTEGENTSASQNNSRILNSGLAINEIQNPSLQCQHTWFNIISLANAINITEIPDHQNDILRSLFFVIMIISFHIFRRHQQKTNALIDEQLNTPADYSVMISNIPKEANSNYEEFLMSLFMENRQIFGKILNVKKINLIYDSEEIEKNEHRLNKIIKQKKEILKHNGFNLEDKEVQKLEKMYEHKELELRRMKFKMIEKRHNFAGKAFVSFSTEDEKELVLKIQKVSIFERLKAFFTGKNEKRRLSKRLYYENNLLYIEQAPEPNEVNWESFHCTTNKKVRMRVIINCLFILLLAGCFGIIYMISYFKSLALEKAVEALHEKSPDATKTYNSIFWLSILISFLITLFNKFCLPKIVHLMVDKEMYSTITHLHLSLAIKLALGCFFNTALITLGVEVITFTNYFGSGGMIESEHMIFIFNAFFAPIVWYIDPWTIQKNWRRRKIMKQVEETGNKVILTQDEANKLMEKVDYNMAKRYADVIKTMWFTFFYAPAIPIGVAWSLVGIFCYYWTDKYNLFKRRTIKEGVSMELSLAMVDMLELCFIWYGVGSLIVEFKFFDMITPISIVFLVYGALKLLLPFNLIINRFFPIKSKNENLDYDEARLEFETDYDRENPVTKIPAIILFFKEKTAKKCILYFDEIIKVLIVAMPSLPGMDLEKQNLDTINNN